MLELAADPRIQPEFRSAQVELVMPVARDGRRPVRASWPRRAARSCARSAARVRVLAAGTHPTAPGRAAITDRPRYRRIARDQRGLHGAGSRAASTSTSASGIADERSRSTTPRGATCRSSRRSPPTRRSSRARDSGLASTRLKLVEDLPRAGTPPAFATWRELAAFVAWGAARRPLPRPHLPLVGPASAARPGHDRVPVRRRADLGRAQRRARRRLPVASSRRCACACGPASGFAVHAAHVIAENRWQAVRDGLDARARRPDTGERSPPGAGSPRLLLELEPYAAELGCSAELEQAWPMLGRNGAARQRDIAARPRRRRPRRRWLADETEAAG